MADKKRIKEIEIILRFLQERKGSYLKRMKFEAFPFFRYEENKLFKELEELTSPEYLKKKWKVINDKAGHYFTPQYLK